MSDFDYFNTFMLWLWGAPALVLLLLSGLDWYLRGEILLGELMNVLLIAAVPVLSFAACIAVVCHLLGLTSEVVLWRRKS